MGVEVQTKPEDNSADVLAAELAAKELADKGTGSLEVDPKTVPEWCAKKFARFNDDGTFNASLSAGALSQAHGSLETKFTQDNQQQSADDKADDKADDETPADDEADDKSDDKADDKPTDSALNQEFWDSLTTEYNENGELSAESRNILHGKGIPDQMIDDYIAGTQARGDQYSQEITSVLGDNGSEQYEALVDWADENMDAAEAKAFNEAIQSNDITRAKVAIRDLKQSYVAAEGSYDGLMLGGSSGLGAKPGITPFGSRHEQSEAMNDKRYSKDPAYRAQVEARTLISNL